MNNKELQNFIDQAKSIKMTAEEKSLLRSKLSSLPIPSPLQIARSPYLAKSHFWTLGKALVAACLIVVLGGGSLSYAAESSLPGQLLYPVKTKFNEEIAAMVKFKPEDKLAWQEKMVERRLKEIEALTERNKLNDRAKIQIEKNLEKHLNKIRKLKKGSNIDDNPTIMKIEKAKTGLKKKENREDKPKQKKLKERDDQERDDIDDLD